MAATYLSKVVAVGPELTKEIAVDDLILTTQFVGDEVKDNYVSFHLIHEDDVLAVIEEEA